MKNAELADKLEALRPKERPEWRVEKEPHDYQDGTTHFNHVRYDILDDGMPVGQVEVGSYLSPNLAELLCLLHNNLNAIVHALRGFPGSKAASNLSLTDAGQAAHGER